jgi:sialate O-acetylesterase
MLKIIWRAITSFDVTLSTISGKIRLLNGNKKGIIHHHVFERILICSFFAFLTIYAGAKVRLPAIFSDNMVLQRGHSIPVWGLADINENVTVIICGQTRTAKSDSSGRWMVRLDSLNAGGPYKMTVTGKNTIVLKNVFVGEVWICSGQSNMELGVIDCNNALEEIATANHPEIHLLSVPFKGSGVPQEDFKAEWIRCSSKSIMNFSAVAYFFGRNLQHELNVPVGLINCSWGASSCEAWMKRSVLEANPQYKTMLQDWDERMIAFDMQKAEEAELLYASWKEKANKAKIHGKDLPPALERLDDLMKIMFAVRRCPSYCYNGMLSPIIPYAIRGVIWYQGETNAERAYQYRKLFPLMIHNWREDWGQGDFPFIFTQLANYKAVREEPGPSDWAELREAQTMTLLTQNTGMAVTIDIGDAKDIHPKNKQDVGIRLALWALSNVYGRNIIFSGPMYNSMEKTGSRIELKFDHCGKGLITKNGEPLRGFSIAGEDQKFVWAEAYIAGNKVIVSSPETPDPVAVRYAWADNPICNLFNSEYLPASPFRTDSWKGLTEK